MSTILNIYINNLVFTEDDKNFQFITKTNAKILFGKHKNEFFACITKNEINASPEIYDEINKIIKLILEKIKFNSLEKLTVNILIHHGLIRDIDDSLFWCGFGIVERKNFKLFEKYQKNRNNLPDRFKNIENICRQFVESNVKF